MALESQWQGRRSQGEATRPSDGSTRTLEVSRKDAGAGESVARPAEPGRGDPAQRRQYSDPWDQSEGLSREGRLRSA